MDWVASRLSCVLSLEHQGHRQVSSTCKSLGRFGLFSRKGLTRFEVDMAIPCTECIPDSNSNFASVRDSFYLLTSMNQFTMRYQASLKREAEGLLRVTLFSKDLRLLNTRETLSEHRTELARVLRVFRKRMVVPAFISTMWFWFAMGISIQTGIAAQRF